MASIVQGFWFGRRLPTIQELSLRSFVAHGHEYHLYAYESIENVPAGVQVRDASTILPRESVFEYQQGFGRGSTSAFSNQFRYKLLFEHGGWWVDTDVVCLRPFDHGGPFVFAAERAPDGNVATASCVIRAPARHPLFAYCLEVIDGVDRATLEWGEIGPRLLHDAVLKYGLMEHREPVHVFNPIDYGNVHQLLTPHFDEQLIAGSFGVHLWNQKWKAHLLDGAYPGPASSLYARLWRRYLPESITNAPDLLERHEAFLRENLARTLAERDAAQYALERNSAELAASFAAQARADQALGAAREELDLARVELTTTLNDLRGTSGELAATRLELAATRDELAAIRESLGAIHLELAERATELGLERGHLLATQTALAQLEEAFALSRAAIARLAEGLASAQSARDAAEALVTGMQSSRSWRLTKPLRTLWDLGRSGQNGPASG